MGNRSNTLKVYNCQQKQSFIDYNYPKLYTIDELKKIHDSLNDIERRIYISIYTTHTNFYMKDNMIEYFPEKNMTKHEIQLSELIVLTGNGHEFIQLSPIDYWFN